MDKCLGIIYSIAGKENVVSEIYPKFTTDQAEIILRNHVGVVCLTPMLPEGGVARCEVSGFVFHIIYLRRIIPQTVGTDRFYETFIHELIHIFHTILGLPINENVVEAECIRFYSLNKDFVKRLYESVVDSQKLLVWNPPIGSQLTHEDRLELIKQKAKNQR